MFDITFSPGPSKISPETYQDLRVFQDKKYGEVSHRSPEFSAISQKTTEQLRAYFKVPDNYHLVWGSSATEMMELLVRSLVDKNSFHFTCGSFSDRWRKIAKNLGKNALGESVEWGEVNDYTNTEIPTDTELITITQSETSTGVGVSNEKIKSVRTRYPDPILAIDSTSIAGSVEVNIADADAWLFSVQKCFGLPSGLGVLIYNDRVLNLAETFPNPMGVLHLPLMHEKMAKNFQTIQTPNTLGIYLLGEQVERWNQTGGITQHSQETMLKNKIIIDTINQMEGVDFFIPNPEDRSPSVECLTASEETIQKAHDIARLHNLLLGGGYGKLKKSTFRIANFPNITVNDIERLREVLTQNW